MSRRQNEGNMIKLCFKLQAGSNSTGPAEAHENALSYQSMKPDAEGEPTSFPFRLLSGIAVHNFAVSSCDEEHRPFRSCDKDSVFGLIRALTYSVVKDSRQVLALSGEA